MDLVIVGTGGHAKEVAFLLERQTEFTLVGFVDDNSEMASKHIYSRPVIGDVNTLLKIKRKTAIVIGIAHPIVKKKIYLKLKKNRQLFYPNLIDETALIGHNVELGMGNILMAYSTYTSDIIIGHFNMLNIGTTIGHDAIIGDFNAFFPNNNLSGNVNVGHNNEFGVGTKVIQKISIGNENIFGAGSVVIRDIQDKSKNVGVPTKKIESWE